MSFSHRPSVFPCADHQFFQWWLQLMLWQHLLSPVLVVQCSSMTLRASGTDFGSNWTKPKPAGVGVRQHAETHCCMGTFSPVRPYVYCIASKLPASHEPVTCHQGTDNSATDASASKGLSMTPAMADILCQYFIFMRRSNVFADITRVTCPWISESTGRCAQQIRRVATTS